MLGQGQASQEMREAAADLKALYESHQLMEGDQYVTAALAMAEQRMQSAAFNYAQAYASQPQPARVAVRPQHRPPGAQDDRQRPYSRMEMRPSTAGVALQVPPLSAPPQAPAAPIARVPAQGHVPTAPGLPDAVIPPNAQLHPRTLARIQQAAGIPPPSTPQTIAQGIIQEATEPVALPAPPPTAEGDLPDLPIMPPPGSPPLR